MSLLFTDEHKKGLFLSLNEYGEPAWIEHQNNQKLYEVDWDKVQTFDDIIMILKDILRPFTFNESAIPEHLMEYLIEAKS